MEQQLVFPVDSSEEQESLGERLARACVPPCVIFLQGELGAGKTTLVRGFLRGLGYTGYVKSPSYSLVEPYELDGFSCFHLDLYRLADPEELEYLGIRDLHGESAAFLVEWPERGEGSLPVPDLLIEIRYRGLGRDVRIQPASHSGRRIVAQIGGNYSSTDMEK
jgi:tRNA threonylcarbamoyladenosine biosynthesis protein TsaE